MVARAMAALLVLLAHGCGARDALNDQGDASTSTGLGSTGALVVVDCDPAGVRLCGGSSGCPPLGFDGCAGVGCTPVADRDTGEPLDVGICWPDRYYSPAPRATPTKRARATPTVWATIVFRSRSARRSSRWVVALVVDTPMVRRLPVRPSRSMHPPATRGRTFTAGRPAVTASHWSSKKSVWASRRRAQSAHA